MTTAQIIEGTTFPSVMKWIVNGITTPPRATPRITAMSFMIDCSNPNSNCTIDTVLFEDTTYYSTYVVDSQ